MHSYLMFSIYLNESNRRYDLGHIETFLLDFVALKLKEGNVPNVKDLINHKQVASQATLHKALTKLISKNLLKLNVANNDGRLKAVLLTNLANERFRELNSAMKKATTTHSK